MSEMVRAAGEVEVDMISVNQIIVETVFPAEWELSTIVNCCKWEGDFLERGNYRRLKLTEQILKIAERITKKLIRQDVDVEHFLS